MRRSCLSILILISIILLLSLPSFATFSITAVDTLTKEVGSAGASCVAGSIMLSDVHPNKGVIHTQAAYLSANQTKASGFINAGYTPQQIVDSVVKYDAQGNPGPRQYGVVDLTNNGRTAGYSGAGCTDYKGHILGKTYTIQGNILLGKQILDSMEARFKRTNGTLADKLMAALQGAKVKGADTRCDVYNKSTISAFIRVAKPADTDKFYLDINVDNTPTSKDPIDSLQKLYDKWLGTQVITADPSCIKNYIILGRNYPNPFTHSTRIEYMLLKPSRVEIKIFSTTGREIITLIKKNQQADRYVITWDGKDSYGKPVNGGVYLYKLQTNGLCLSRRMLLLR